MITFYNNTSVVRGRNPAATPQRKKREKERVRREKEKIEKYFKEKKKVVQLESREVKNVVFIVKRCGACGSEDM